MQNEKYFFTYTFFAQELLLDSIFLSTYVFSNSEYAYTEDTEGDYW